MFDCLEEQCWVAGRKAMHSQEEEINNCLSYSLPSPIFRKSARTSRVLPLASPRPGNDRWIPSPSGSSDTTAGLTTLLEMSPTPMCSHFKGIGALPPLTQVSVFNVEAKCTHFGGKLCRKILYISAEANGF